MSDERQKRSLASRPAQDIHPAVQRCALDAIRPLDAHPACRACWHDQLERHRFHDVLEPTEASDKHVFGPPAFLAIQTVIVGGNEFFRAFASRVSKMCAAEAPHSFYAPRQHSERRAIECKDAGQTTLRQQSVSARSVLVRCVQ